MSPVCNRRNCSPRRVRSVIVIFALGPVAWGVLSLLGHVSDYGASQSKPELNARNSKSLLERLSPKPN